MEQSLKLLSEYGLSGFIIMTTVIFIMRLLHTDYKSQLSSLVSNLTGNSTDRTVELKYHPFFSSVHYKIVVEIPALDICSDKPIKQEMFRDLLTIYAKNMLDTCSSIVEMDMADWSGEKWSNEVNKNLNKMVTEFNRKAVDNGVPPTAVQYFAKLHYQSLEMMREYILSLGTSGISPNNHSRTGVLLLLMNLLLVTTIADAEKYASDNFDPNGLYYKNSPLEH